jgi:nitrogen-specific signal transduction histidine kinase
MIIAIVSIMLMVINQYITSPIIHYCRAIFPEEKDTISLFTLHKSIENMAAQPLQKLVQPDKKNIAELSRLYRNSSIGNMFGGISNELTNRSNGIINYTQALLDISNDLQLDHDTQTLLKKLFVEEKKMAELLTHMIQFTGGGEDGIANSLSLDDIFSHIGTLVQGTFKQDRISLIVTLDDPARTLNYHVNDLQLVILSALQNSRIALKRKDAETTKELRKEIDISVDDTNSANSISINIRDNGSPWELNSTQLAGISDRPWHNMHFCNDFLKTFNGKLVVKREPDQSNLCVIEIPLQDTLKDKKDVAQC